MKGAVALCCAGMLLAGGALAKPGTPGPGYFAGTYDRVGRSGGAAPLFLNDRVSIVPVGPNVVIRPCTGPETLMAFGPAFEIVNLMTGLQGSKNVDCLFHNNGYNRPILTCRVADGGAFTLWPTEAPELVCAG